MMNYLTEREILAQLEKLGLSSTSDLATYFNEYKEYLAMQSMHHFVPQDFFDRSDD